MAVGYPTAALSMGHLALKRASRHAEANDLLAGIGTEQARALHQAHVDLDDPAASPPGPPHVAVWRSGTPLGGQGLGQIAISVV
jgi:hypothetical protein